MNYGDITSCSVVGHGTRNEYQCRLGYQIISEDITTNTRKIKLQLEARTINEKYTTYGMQQTTTIDGYELAPKIIDIRRTNIWVILDTSEIEIKGAFKGTKTGSFVVNVSSEWALKSGKANVYIELENLHTPPTINSIDVQEVNDLLNSFDGIVQSLSFKIFSFDTTTYDDATILSYQIHHNGVLIGSNTQNGMTIDFDKVGALATFVMNEKTYCTLKFTIIDSLGVSNSIEKQYQVIKYVKPNLVKTSSNIKRNGQLTGKVKLNLIGTFFNQVVNDTQNTISLKFAYWKKGEDESTIYYDIPFEPTLNDNNINIYNWNIAIKNEDNEYIEIEDVSKDYAYYFKIIATDYFNNKSDVVLLCPVGEYVWAEFKDRVDFKAITIKGVHIEEQFKQNIITAYLTSTQITSAAFQKIELSNAVSIGEKLTLTSLNQIKIGSGISKVKISATVSTEWDSAPAPDSLIGIFRNGEIIARINGYKMDANKSTSISASPFVLDVQEGDVIHLSYFGTNANNKISGAPDYYLTYMTVEEIKI